MTKRHKPMTLKEAHALTEQWRKTMTKHFWRDATQKVTSMATRGPTAYTDPEAGNEKVEMYEHNLIEVDSNFKGTYGDLLRMIVDLQSTVETLENTVSELESKLDAERSDY